ncbi:MAG TPA: sigma-70 family RNA polymerase sigma factor [Gemmatimonadales bacterium]|nr:sigma-70 family RNA polymerase sigma factor [Gemmatimonadales bacterium]
MTGAAREAVEARFDRLLKEHGPALSRLAFGYEKVAAAREDLMQEIALAIWQALPRFRGECSERTFVFRIAHNRGLTHAVRRPPAHDSLTEEREHIDPRPLPDEHAARAHRRDWLRAAIRRLTPLYREVIMLTLEELSTAEIAEILGITENNVAVRLSRARQSLKQALEEAL